MKRFAIFLIVLFCLSVPSGCAVTQVSFSGENASSDALKYSLYGDADADGTVTAADAGAILRVAASRRDPEKDRALLLACDVDYDGSVTSADARTVFRAVNGLTELGEGTPHEHKWQKWKTEASATCVSYGVEKRCCKNDTSHFQIKYTAKLSHKLSLVEQDIVKDRLIFRAPFFVCSSCGGYFVDGNGKTALVPDSVVYPVSEDKKAACDALFNAEDPLVVQAAVIKDGVVDTVYCRGTAQRDTGREVNDDTKYRVASISKLVSCMVFFCLEQDGLVDRNADISDYFGYECRNPYYPDIVITPLMIMSHKATMIDSGPYSLGEDTLSSYSFYIPYEPGGFYSYSNTGFAVIQSICESVTGTEFDTLAKKYVFEPMGIDAAYIASGLKDQSNIGELTQLDIETMLSRTPQSLGRGLNFAQGNLYISAKDYASILCLLLNDGVSPGGKRILSSESIAAMEKTYFDGGNYRVALGMLEQTNLFPGKTVYCHTGSSYGLYSTFVFCPEEKTGMVVIISGSSSATDPETEIYTSCLGYIRALYPRN
ncbi:MAG: serine hydrolase [Clostridia bacterium]|nr:serine hydrolase [Clostridia bacterium]